MISIIIPVYNASSFLNKLLLSIDYQEIDKKKFEVIFIDNNSTDDSFKILEKYCKSEKSPRCILLSYIVKQSSYAARNFGLKHTSGSIYVFTDADCILDKSYLKNVYEFFEIGKDQDKIIAGGIELVVENTKNIWENFDNIAHLNNDKSESINKIATANLVVSKKQFDYVGKFLEVKSTGDSEWSRRATTKGLKVQFKKEFKIYHPTRKTFEEINKKYKRIGFGYGERWNKNVVILLLYYFLKIFNFKTNITLSKKMIHNIGIRKVILFNFYFELLRVNQLINAIKGYYNK